MFKWILWVTLIFWWVWYFLASASYTPISKQIDVKTMQIHSPKYIISKSSKCTWTCRNYSSSSSYGWWSSGCSLLVRFVLCALRFVYLNNAVTVVKPNNVVYVAGSCIPDFASFIIYEIVAYSANRFPQRLLYIEFDRVTIFVNSRNRFVFCYLWDAALAKLPSAVTQTDACQIPP